MANNFEINLDPDAWVPDSLASDHRMVVVELNYQP